MRAEIDPDDGCRRLRRRMPPGPALPIILAAGVVQVVRQNLLDVIVFFGTALVIVVDAAVMRRPMQPRDGPPHAARSGWSSSPRRVLGGPGWVLLAAPVGGLLGLTGLGSPVTRVVLAVAGVAALVITLRGPADLMVPPLPWGWRVWATVALAIAAWELAAWLSQDDPDVGNPNHPTLSTLADPVLASTIGRCLLCAAWAAGFVWLVRALALGGVSDVGANPAPGRGPTPGHGPDDGPATRSEPGS